MSQSLRVRFAIPVLLAALSGCRGCERTPAIDSDAGRAVDASSSSIDVRDDAGGTGAVSLLAWTDARIAVSSAVANPKDFPEHLIDGKRETAWNGKTGDLHGFIAFRVPKEARVHAIRLTPGFDRVDKAGQDLFYANHRVTKVRIERDGGLVKEASLDPVRREMQSIPLDVAGGDFVVRIVETLPGKKASWKELTISEFDVVGDPGSARRAPPRLPRVRVGSLEAAEPEERKTPSTGAASYPSAKAYCAGFVAHHEPLVRARYTDGTYYCSDPSAHATCGATEGGTAIEGAAPFAKVRTIDFAGEEEEGTLHVIETAEGAIAPLGAAAHGRCELGDVGTSAFEIESTRGTRTAAGEPIVLVVLRNDSFNPMYSDEEGNPAIWVQAQSERTLRVCRILGARPDCGETHVLGTFDGKNEVATDRGLWRSPKTFVLGPDGKIALEGWVAKAP